MPCYYARRMEPQTSPRPRGPVPFLRLPAPSNHFVTPPQDDVLVGDDGRRFRIRAGTDLFLPIHNVHKNPALWEKPEEFRPERCVGSFFRRKGCSRMRGRGVPSI